MEVRVCRMCGLESSNLDLFVTVRTSPKLVANRCRRCARLWHRYRIYSHQYDARLMEQEGRCAICGSLPDASWGKGVLVVDHDHTSGKVRGLLCGYCNSGLGHFKDDPLLLGKAAAYLSSHS